MGAIVDKLTFDKPTKSPDGVGGVEVGWTEQFTRRAQIIYQRGGEGIEAARLKGSAIYKVKLRRDSLTATITPDWRARDARRGTEYNIREADSITDRAWVYLVIEGGVAV